MRGKRFALIFAALACTFGAKAASLSETDLATLRSAEQFDPQYRTTVTSKAALELARRIGSEGNIDGMQAIIDVRNQNLLMQALQYVRVDPSRTLPEPLERLIVKNYSNPIAQRPLLGLIGGGTIDRQSGRSPKYRSRALFDLLYASLKAGGNEGLHYAIRIVATDLQGVEAPLTALLSTLDPAAADELVSFLARKKYDAAVPALRALQQRVTFARNQNGLLGNIDRAYVEIGSTAALDALFDRIGELGRHSDVRNAELELAGFILNLASMPADSQPDYVRLRNALPKQLGQNTLQYLVSLIEKRKDRRGMPDLLSALGYGNENALDAILALGKPEDWRTARVQLDRAAVPGTAAPQPIARLRQRLDDALADSARFIEKRTVAERRQQFEDARLAVDSAREKLSALKAGDPQRYAADMQANLDSAAALAASNVGLEQAAYYCRDVAKAYAQLAVFSRFTLRDPARAVMLYERAIALSERLPTAESSAVIERAGLADTLRFDLNNPTRALSIYRQMQQQASAGPPSPNETEALFQGVLNNWLSAEIAFLAEGKRYDGVPDRDTVAAIALIGAWSAENLGGDDPATAFRSRAPKKEDDAAFGQQLELLSPSQIRLLNTAAYLPLLATPERIERFLRKHDPAGFLTANIFAATHLIDNDALAANGGRPAPGVHVLNWSAGERELMRLTERRMFGQKLLINTEPDPRLASPELTWKTFIDALGRGDLDAAWKCTTPGIRNKFAAFQKMTPSQLKEMSASVTGFKRSAAFDEYVEAWITRSNGGAYSVTFRRQGKEWRIAEM